MKPDLTILAQRWEYQPPRKTIDGAMWLCERCGWQGRNHFHADGAMGEGMRHMRETHPEIVEVRVDRV